MPRHSPLSTRHSLARRSSKSEGGVIAVGLSGGVDSAVAAALLKQQGHTIVGVTALVWPGSRCCSDSSILEAKKVCHQLGIKHYLIDLTREFKHDVVDNFVDEYFSARTPNPCTRCNFFTRFGDMYTKVKKEIERDFGKGDVKLATGHYARTIVKQGKYYLKEGKDKTKDQVYMLYRLDQDQLRNFVTPLGKLTKKHVRKLAKKFKLSPAERKDSQDACFIDDNCQKFLTTYSNRIITPGNFVDGNGKVLGRHKGMPFYTIGQRRGLGISATHPLYVLKLDLQRNEIVLGPSNRLLKKELTASDVHWTGDIPRDNSCLECKIRYNSKKVSAYIENLPENRVRVRFKKPQSAVTPGQNIVFYKKDIVLGGGVIDKE